MIIDLGLPTLTAPPTDRSERLAAVRDGMLGSVHSWELVTAVDGPGTRLTIFLAGCALRCQYCHNPDTWNINHGRDLAVDDLVALIDRYATIMTVTGGGVTVSGGEPLLQPAFVARIFQHCAERGIHTALDTSGFLGARAVRRRCWPTPSLVLLDVKSGLPDVYRETTGRELQPTLDFGRRLARAGQADVDPVRPRARAHRRRRQRRGGRRRTPHRCRPGIRRIGASGSRCCPSTSWAATSGTSSVSSTRSRTPRPRRRS